MDFSPPSESEVLPSSMVDQLAEYFRERADSSFQIPEGCLPFPFLSPGGSYSTQLWDWDSYWISRGLFALAQKTEDQNLAASVAEHAKGSLQNFFHLQKPNGAIPILASPIDGDVFEDRPDPKTPTNPAKPIFAQFLLHYCQQTGDWDFAKTIVPGVCRFHAYLSEEFLSPSGLLVWAQDAAIGVDNDPATYGRPFYSSANLLLNCLLHEDLRALEEICEHLGERGQASGARTARESLSANIRTECWDPACGFFFSVDVQCEDHRARLIPEEIPRGMEMPWTSVPLKFFLFTGFLPLWTPVASPDQAERLLSYLSEDHFMGEQGFRTLSAAEKLYDPATESSNPSNWLGPAWTIATYFVWKGLRRYGYMEHARTVARLGLDLLGEGLRTQGAVFECYDPDTGAPNFNRHFLSWNLLVLEMVEKEGLG